MKQGYTHISVILDRSGSMESVKSDTIGGLNKFLADQKACPGEATITLVQFDDRDPYEVINDCVPIKEAKDLTEATYTPRGWTPLLDAIGRGINDLGAKLAAKSKDQRPEKVLFVILTDGLENDSMEFSKAKILEMIRRQTETFKWQFMYLGANQDAIAVGMGMGIPKAASMQYTASPLGVAATFNSASSQACSYRSGLTAGVSFTEEDRRSAKS